MSDLPPHSSAPPSPAAPAPFAGLVVVELGHSVAAPFAGQILAELGARVIKIEKADGDDARRWGPPFWEGASAFFQTLNRNKESVVCELRDPQQLEALRALIVEHADIVLQNLRPGHVEKLGLDGPSLLALKPSLIYCNLGAFGATGPLKDRPGYDPLMQAFGGIMSTTGEVGRPSVRVGASIVDMGTGLWGVVGILTALFQRQISGLGQIVDVSLFETASTWVSLLAAQVMASGQLSPKQGSGSPGIVPYKAYATADGELVVAAGSNPLFRSLAAVLGHPEWADDPRYIDNPARVAHETELYGLIDALMLQQPTAHWVSALEAAGVPCAPVNNLLQMMAHPQTEALGLLQGVPGTGMRFIGLPLSFNGQRPHSRSAPPTLGQHNHLLGTPADKT
jgi:crotonobetainyl-CoA:carnitine CoA-transferase CaiB-like acyl-CoA transferase